MSKWEELAIEFDNVELIREHINERYKQIALFEDKKKWHQVCCCLDAIEDTKCAIRAYVACEYPDVIDYQYLYTYGLLQALFIQQDAISDISNALFNKSVDYKNEYPQLYRIREMRNDILHPTNRERGKKFVLLVQISLSKDWFEYLASFDETKNDEFIKVDVFDTIQIQESLVEAILMEFSEELEKELVEYCDMHKDRKIRDLFSKIQYAREKLSCANDALDIAMKGYHLDCVRELVQKYKEELTLRYEDWENDVIKDTIYKIDEILSIIDATVETRIESHLIEHMFCLIDELKNYAEELDKWFANYGKDEVEDQSGVINVIISGEVDE